MSSTVVDPKGESQTVEGNRISTGSLRGPFTPEAENSLVDHPLWHDFLAELQASRQADIAEQIRLAHLELEKEKQMTLDLL